MKTILTDSTPSTPQPPVELRRFYTSMYLHRQLAAERQRLASATRVRDDPGVCSVVRAAENA